MVSTDALNHGFRLVTPIVQSINNFLNWGAGFITIKNIILALAIFFLFYFWSKAEKAARQARTLRRL